jgi:hypothetical protein
MVHGLGRRTARGFVLAASAKRGGKRENERNLFHGGPYCVGVHWTDMVMPLVAAATDTPEADVT